MKYAISTLIFLLAAPAFAQVRFLNEINPKLPKIQIAKGKNLLSNTVITPVRMARLKVEISKLTVVDNGDGTATQASQVICTKEIETPVFDLRNIGGWASDGTDGATSCPSTLNGQPVTVNVSSWMFLVHGSFFEGDAPEDFKYASASIYADATGHYNYFAGGARGINATSFIGSTGGGIEMTCGSDGNGGSTCTVSSALESFSANFEFIDQ